MKTLQNTKAVPKYKVHPAQVPFVLLGLPLGLLGEWYQGIITGFEGERLRGDGPTPEYDCRNAEKPREFKPMSADVRSTNIGGFGLIIVTCAIMWAFN